MAYKAILDSLDDIPEHLHELYTERNGKFELTGFEGIRTQADVDRLQSSLTKERNDHKSAKDKLGVFASLGDLDEVRTKLDRFPELEAAAAGKLDDAAIDKLVTARLTTKLAPVERERDTLKGRVSELEGTVQSFTLKERTRMIHDAVRTAAVATKVLDTAAEDVLLIAERIFEVGDDGKVTAKEGVGCTPGIEPHVWLAEQQTRRPHWWPTSIGGGGKAGNGNAGGANPWTHDAWNVTEQNRIYRESSTRAEQLAKSAGTKIGGMKPAKK